MQHAACMQRASSVHTPCIQRAARSNAAACIAQVDIVSLGCVESLQWSFDFVLQLLLPVLVALVAFTPYSARLLWNKIQPETCTEMELRDRRNQAVATSFKFLNVVYLR